MNGTMPVQGGPDKVRIGVLVSGSGSNLQAIVDAVEKGDINGEIVVVLSNKPDAYALTRAKNHGIDTEIVIWEDYDGRMRFTQAVVEALMKHNVELLCFAGFMRILDPVFFQTFAGRILNIHPALLPAFGGKGMYGHHVHEAVLESGARFSGATVHFVTEETDVGPIISQDVVPVDDDDTPDSLAKKVLEIEHRIYPEAVGLYCSGILEIDGMRVKRRKSC